MFKKALMSGVGFVAIFIAVSFLPFGGLNDGDGVAFLFVFVLALYVPIIFVSTLITLYINKLTDGSILVLKLSWIIFYYCLAYAVTIYLPASLSDHESVLLLLKYIFPLQDITPFLTLFATPIILEQRKMLAPYSDVLLYGLCVPALLAVYWILPPVFS